MVVSRVLPTLIRFNVLINPIIKARSVSCSGYLQNSFRPAIFVKFSGRPMSVEVNKEILNDPKRHLSYEQFLERRKSSNVIVIDVRQPGEITETGKIPNSINIPLDTLRNALEMSSEEFSKVYLIPKPKTNDEIIFSCLSGRRSLAAMKTALELGYIHSANYKGGWQEWAEKNPE